MCGRQGHCCRVFDHLTEMMSVPASRLKSDRVNCLVGSNVVRDFAATFDCLKKPGNMIRTAAATCMGLSRVPACARASRRTLGPAPSFCSGTWRSITDRACRVFVTC